MPIVDEPKLMDFSRGMDFLDPRLETVRDMALLFKIFVFQAILYLTFSPFWSIQNRINSCTKSRFFCSVFMEIRLLHSSNIKFLNLRSRRKLNQNLF